jgi:lysophospholipase L1-like esterase
LKRNASSTVWVCPPDGVTTSSFYVCDGDDAKNKGGYQPSARSKISAQGVSVDLYNWGFAGELSSQILGRVSQAMSARPAKYVFIMAGINDVGFGISSGSIAFNVRRMIDRVCERGLIPVLGLITPRFDGGSYNSKIQVINDAIREYAESLNVPVADNYNALIGNWNAYQSGDNLHIGNAGDSAMATQWASAFQYRAGACRAASAVPSTIQLLLLDE